ncbi:MAG: (Fe-S)-binding protein [Dehalococcoidia bacterium]
MSEVGQAVAAQRKVRASLFVTCLVDQFFPEVGEGVVKVLRGVGVEVDFPEAQTCCGQPAFNSGFHREALAVARNAVEAFRHSEYVIVPAGSCATMVKLFYPHLFRHDPPLQREVQALGQRTYEFSQFLVNVLGITDVGASYQGRVTYHASCHLLRELGVSQEPLALLRAVKGVKLAELPEAGACCGFGGTFAIKYPHISEAVLEDKLRNLETTGAQVLVAGDMGCLMHIGGALSRRGSSVKVMHLAQLLAQEG